MIQHILLGVVPTFQISPSECFIFKFVKGLFLKIFDSLEKTLSSNKESTREDFVLDIRVLLALATTQELRIGGRKFNSINVSAKQMSIISFFDTFQQI